LRAVYLDVLTSWNIFQAHFLIPILVVFILQIFSS
jgi:hypothetical protein